MTFNLSSTIGFIIPWSLIILLGYTDFILFWWNIPHINVGDINLLNTSWFLLLSYLLWFFLRKNFSFFINTLNHPNESCSKIYWFLFWNSCKNDPRDTMFGKRSLVKKQLNLILPGREDAIKQNYLKKHTAFYLILSRIRNKASSSTIDAITHDFHQLTLSSKLCSVFLLYLINFSTLFIVSILGLSECLITSCIFFVLSLTLLRISYSLLRKSYLDWTKWIINAFLML